MRYCACFLAFLSTALASKAFAWGDTGHQTINAAATSLMESDAAAFFQANKGPLAKLATVPDVEWKHTNYQEERPMHFFQWDQYRTTAVANSLDSFVYSQVMGNLGANFIGTNGSSVWRVSQIYRKLVTALHQKNWTQSLQMAAVLGHYIGDLSQPMHDTSDYDGQSINQRGIHAYYEITLVDQQNKNALMDDAVNGGGPCRQGLDDINLDQSAGDSGAKQVRGIVLAEGQASYAKLQGLLTDFADHPQDNGGLAATFNDRLGAGAATLAKVWDMAAMAAATSGYPQQELSGVNAPAWMALGD